MRSEKLAEENGGGVVGGGGEEGGWQHSFPNTRTRRSPPCHLCWILTRDFTRRQLTLVSHGTSWVTCNTRFGVQKLLHVPFILWHCCICTIILRGQMSTPVSGYRGYQTSKTSFFFQKFSRKTHRFRADNSHFEC